MRSEGGEGTRSGDGAFIDGPAAEVRALEGRGQVGGLVRRADIDGLRHGAEPVS